MFADVLKELRTNHHMTQKDLGLLISVDKTTVSKYESGDIFPPAETLVKIADVFSVPIDVLLERKTGSLMEMKNFKSLLKKRKLSLQELSQQLNYPYGSLMEFYKGYYFPSNYELFKIADYFGVSTDYLLGKPESSSSPAVIMGFGGPGQIAVPDKKSDKYQELLQLLDGLSDEQINVLIQVAQSMKQSWHFLLF